MFTVNQVRETLELSDYTSATDAISSLKLNRKWYDSLCDAVFDFELSSPFYFNIYKDIALVLRVFREMSQGMEPVLKSLTVAHIGFVLDRIGEPWPDITIATAIQYQLLKIKNKFIPISEIMTMSFHNIDE